MTLNWAAGFENEIVTSAVLQGDFMPQGTPGRSEDISLDGHNQGLGCYCSVLRAEVREMLPNI